MKKIQLPALVDPHVHLRDPGAIEKEDFATGTRAAVAGGITAVFDMPNNPEPTISDTALEKKINLARKKAVCDWGLIFGASQNDNTAEYEKIYDRVAGLKIYMDTTTGDLLLEEKDILEQTFQAWNSMKPIIVHAEDETMTKAIALAKKFNRRLHIAHLSQKKELQRVMVEKEKGMDITCEVTPHHLYLTEKDAKALGPYGSMKPPLRTQKDVDFLWKHIDAVDCIATDHAPHTRQEKESGSAPYGVPGLETSLPLMLTAVHENKIEIEDVVRLMHEGPVSVFRCQVPGNSYTEVDLHSKYEIRNEKLFTKCGWSPFDGMNVVGKVVKTVIRGREVYNGEEILVKKGFGEDIVNNT